MSAQILKMSCETDTASLRLPGYSEHCITVQSDQNRQDLLQRTIENLDAVILSEFVFAGTQHYPDFMQKAENDRLPLVWLQGDACRDGGIYSMQAVAVSGMNPEPVVLNGRTAGFVYEDDVARYCRLSGVLPADCKATREQQTVSVYRTVESVLAGKGFAFTDIIRTWIYMDRLLEWYGPFNTVRTDFFKAHGTFDKLVPASTGIGAGNPFGAAITMDVLAVQPKEDRLRIREVVSPMQNPALDYKSSFSRAVELDYPEHRSLLISGTASIDPDGKTVFQDDPEQQIRLTMEVIHAILKSKGMDWDDLFRGIAYFKNMSYLPVYRRIAAELGIPRFPLAVSHADVCRHDLLFEIEVDAIQASRPAV